MLLFLFLLSAGFVVYIYALFPVWLHIRASGKPELSAVEPTVWPTVSVVIAAHNEAKNLPIKFQSLTEMDYPEDKIEWIVVSDGSSDNTKEVAAEWFGDHDNRTLLHLDTPHGKCGALNEGVAIATGEIILFMDARQPISPNTAKRLIPFLLDPQFGAATGELVLSEDSSLEAANFGLYWRYEKWIRDNQSRLFSTTGVTGALYAIRRKDFKPNPIGTLLDDFDTPVGLLKDGKRTVFVPGAYAFDAAADDIHQEFRRKVRNLGGNWQSFSHNPWLYNPVKNPVWLQFMSHKFGRLIVPWALIIAFLTALFGLFTGSAFLSFMFLIQVIYYALAIASYMDLPFARAKILNFPKIFVQMNAAAIVGTVKYFFSKKASRWR